MLTLTTWNAVINILSVPVDQRGSVISAARDDAGITALLSAVNRDRGALLERLDKLDVLPDARAPLGYEVTSCVPNRAYLLPAPLFTTSSRYSSQARRRPHRS